MSEEVISEKDASIKNLKYYLSESHSNFDRIKEENITLKHRLEVSSE